MTHTNDISTTTETSFNEIKKKKLGEKKLQHVNTTIQALQVM